MSERAFDDRLAALQEHIIKPPRTTSDEWLDRAEQALAEGQAQLAQSYLSAAQTARVTEDCLRLEDEAQAWEEDDDA